MVCCVDLKEMQWKIPKFSQRGPADPLPNLCPHHFPNQTYTPCLQWSDSLFLKGKREPFKGTVNERKKVISSHKPPGIELSPQFCQKKGYAATQLPSFAPLKTDVHIKYLNVFFLRSNT